MRGSWARDLRAECIFKIKKARYLVNRFVRMIPYETGFLRLRGDFSYDDDAEAFLHLIDGGLSSPRAQMDPAEETREMKRQKEHYIMLQCAADTQYGIPTRCLCGSRISKNYEIERLTKRVKESEEVILLVAKLNKQIDTLEEQVQDLTVKVHVLEKLCFD
ncbi:hypothetical protein Bca52824_057547 [Brassica carinata]|uniref:Uncharacterized protein n=1 Tax=Brassica carinata TaxID=52824 RepID=A0A8X7QSA6_BRACI|nr:hypothetical protein Bca52824_057547 [Brassica carinata]